MSFVCLNYFLETFINPWKIANFWIYMLTFDVSGAGRFLIHCWSFVTWGSVQTNRSKTSSTATSPAKARGHCKSCSTPTWSSETRANEDPRTRHYLGSYCLRATHQKEHLEICSADWVLTTDQFIIHLYIYNRITWEEGTVKAWIRCYISDQMPQTALNLLGFALSPCVNCVMKGSPMLKIYSTILQCKPTSLRTWTCIQHM